MIASCIQLNNLYVKQIETIGVNHIPEVQWGAILLQPKWKKVYSPLDQAYREEVNDSDSEKMDIMVASVVQWLHWRLMSLINKYHTSTLIYRP